MSSDLQGKSVIVTAAGNGIGKASAIAFAQAGAKVIVNDVREDLAKATTEQIAENGGTARAITADVTQFEKVQALVQAALDSHDGLDVLFNVAGGAFPMPFATTPLEVDQNIIALNLNSALYGAKAALPVMLKQGHGIDANKVTA